MGIIEGTYGHYTLAARHAIERIKNDYGDDVYIKPKALLKYGRNQDLDSGVSELVWEQGGNETLPSDNVIDTISSSNAGDTQMIVVEGHTVSGSNLTFVVQTATLNGQNQVTLSTPLYRSSRIYNATNTGDGNGAGDFLGNIYVYESGGTVTGGVPQDATKIHLFANSNGNQSNKCATSISSSDYWIVYSVTCGVKRSSGQTRVVDFTLQWRGLTNVWRTLSRLTASTNSGSVEITYDPPIIIPKNSDVRITGISSGDNTEVEASINGYLAQIL